MRTLCMPFNDTKIIHKGKLYTLIIFIIILIGEHIYIFPESQGFFGRQRISLSIE